LYLIFAKTKRYLPIMTTKLLVLISGNGSNLQAILDAVARCELDAEVVAVISNVANAFGLTRAQRRGVPTEIIDHKTFANRDAFDQALLQRMNSYNADLVMLAGFMRILSKDIVETFLGRMINIHPSLLPKYPGLHTHQRALEAGDQDHGCSVHFVTPELDGGPVIAQARCAIFAKDNSETLAHRVHQLEHRLYPAVIKAYCDGRLSYQNGHSQLQGDAIVI
jgi:phosphoribosylglycinamide formyltransferase-1